MNNPTLKEKIQLIRNSSGLSEIVEQYLEKNYHDYSVFYSNEKDYGEKLPAIYSPISFLPYHGEAGFNIFKQSHPEVK